MKCCNHEGGKKGVVEMILCILAIVGFLAVVGGVICMFLQKKKHAAELEEWELDYFEDPVMPEDAEEGDKAE